ncbi:metallopeptidase TldD-related protein [Acidicapsa ligni]|uniref:metallopeptidase TldD-related protein n=1 Tax=Acidicapsa ligni TaxID=542300 RepID=UPI0021DFC881|nr:metallopeptidase TldD-related protein [Acidicapsa ligni]
MKRFVIPFAALALLTSSLIANAEPSRADAEKDPVLKAMLAELDRSREQLQLKGFEKPFFIQYRIEDIEDYQTKGDFGASVGEDNHHQRIARITVRVGDYKTDSSTARGDGAVQLAALDNDPLALRASLWQATDQAYKDALSAYARKLAQLKQVQTPPQADDFSHESPVISLEDTVSLKVDGPQWARRVAAASGLYRTDASLKASEKDVQYATAMFHARAANIYLVNTEGTIVRKGQTSFEESFAVGTQAADGMHLDRSYASNGEVLKDIDSPEAFTAHAVKLIASLSDLRKAPLVEEEYHGPILLSADASADVMHELVAPNIIATRPDLGTEARTKGAFASSYHARVLPEIFSVIDDPGLRTFKGKNLVGAYTVDDEGVIAQPVKLVTDGRLENYLIGREPVRDFPKSNGHGRAALAGPAYPAIGVLQVSAKDGIDDGELNKKLLALAKDRDLKSVYFVETLGPELTPRLLYRVSVDGTRELVRGATLDDLDQRTLRSGIVAAGKEPFVANYIGAVPETVLAPALLFDDVTVRRANEKNDKLPFYPPPS